MPSFLQTGNSFFPPQSMPPTVYQAISGTTIPLASGVTRVYLTPAGTLATLTIKLPPGPRPGQDVSILSTQVVTALTVQNSAGVAVAGAPTSLAINTEVLMRYTGTVWVWVK